MLSDIPNIRENKLKELERFTLSVSQELNDITTALGWTLESITNRNENFLECPYNPSHRIPERSLSKHLEKCRWKAEGYAETDTPLSEPALPAGAPSSICFDEERQAAILHKARDTSMKIEDLNIVTGTDSIYPCLEKRLIPHTSDRLLADFTSEERKVLYEYVIANTVKPDIGNDIEDICHLTCQDKEEKEISLLELLVQERNLKRRRAKHRGVHTNKKSHTEVMREVINQQMEIYNEYINVRHSTAGSSETIHDPEDIDANAKIKLEEVYEETSSLKYSCYEKSMYTHYTSKEHNEQHSKNEHQYDKLVDKTYSYERRCKKHERNSSNDKIVLQKRKHSHRDRSGSTDRRSHKKSKHSRKEDRHKRKKHRSNERHRTPSEKRHSKDNYHKHKDKIKSKDR